MAGAYTHVNLSQLPPPTVVEQVDFETILAEMVADLRARAPEFDALVESDPAFKVLEVCAYRIVLERRRANESAIATMLAFAKGSDLDQLGANVDVARLVIDAGNPNAVPPIPPTYESDADFRARIQLSFEGYTTAGSEGSYIFHALSADGDVKDAVALSPSPGVVDVYVLSRTGDGTALPELLGKVSAALNAEDVRPLTDMVTVQSAWIVPYQVVANLKLLSGPDSAVVLAAALAALDAYTTDAARIGRDVTISGLMAALHQPGVENVELIQPTANVVIAASQASHCASKSVAVVNA